MDAKVMLFIMLGIDIMLFGVSYAVADLNPAMDFYGYDGSIAKVADTSSGAYETRAVTGADIPGGPDTVDPETGGFFTDITRSVRNWLFDNIPGAKTAVMVINAVPSFLSAVGAPQVFVYIVGAFWHIAGLFMLISFVWGR
ncbi:MAG: hypothetical protein LC650_01975 [Actinobacteria bacterium]|nr:hypothetical protein [Actinomycetota bacterium]